SNLQVATPEAASETLQNVIGVPVQSVSRQLSGGTEEISETLRTQQAGTEIWNVFLLLALIFLAAEMLVASQWTPETASA
ncbi:MAG: hypothetical protein BRD33_01975, partial [Bacteroidetes bacterium QH_6_63_17]